MKRGETYISKIWMDHDRRPIPMRITKIVGKTIYYRPYYGKHDDGSDWLGSVAYFPLEQASKWLNMED